MSVRKIDTDRAVNLLKMFQAKLKKSEDKSLPKALEKLIEILESQVYSALLDIHELYEDSLINNGIVNEQPIEIVEEVIMEEQVPQPGTSHREREKKPRQSHKSEESMDQPDGRTKYKLPESPIPQEYLYQEAKYEAEEHLPEEPVDLEEEDDRWEYIEVQLNKGKKGYGFAVGGGFDKNLFEGDSGIYVTKIVPGGAADVDGRLRLDDALMSVNETNLEYVLHDTAVEILKNAGKSMTLILRRFNADYQGQEEPGQQNQADAPLDLYSLPQEQYSDQEPSDHLKFQEFEIILTKKSGAGLGFTVNGGHDSEDPDQDSFVYISRLTPGGVADVDGRLEVNDVLLMVDNQSLHGLTHDESVSLLKNTGRTVKLFVGRFLEDIPEESIPVKTQVQVEDMPIRSEKKKKKHRRDRNEE